VLSDRIDDIHESLRKTHSPEISDDEEGRFFLRKLVRDWTRLRAVIEENDLFLDRRGWIAVDLFPVTFEILNRHLSPGDKVYVGHGRYGICVVYYGISPELENFVVTCLWPEKSGTSKLAYRRIYDIVSKDSLSSRVIRFGQDFGLEPPNLIHPYNDRTIEAIEKPKSVYDWQYVPYLREIGNTLLSHKSPLNFQKIFLETKEGPLPVYVNVKSSIGFFREIRKDEANVLVPSLFWSDLGYRTRITPEVFSQLKNNFANTPYHFLIQERAEENIIPTIFRVSPAKSSEVASTLLLFTMYILFLGSRRLMILPWEQFIQLFKFCVKRALQFCRESDSGLQLWTPDTFFATYLSPFFRKIGQQLFYTPHFLSRWQDSILQVFDSRLAENRPTVSDGPLFGSDGAWLNKAILGRQYQMLRFTIDAKRFIWWSGEHNILHQAIRNVLSR